MSAPVARDGAPPGTGAPAVPLAVRNLTKEFRLRDGRGGSTLVAVDDVSFELPAGQTVALVGESGSGKSTIARMIARLEVPSSGRIELDGQVLDRRSTRGRMLRRYRSQVQMVFQDPFSSLNPFHTVGHHLRRPLRIHRIAKDRDDETAQVHQLLERVGLVPAERVAAKRPHELSGGQRQRVAIARALAVRPRVLVADEPVSMLDVSVRLEILGLIARLQREDDLAVLYITHDLVTARHFSRSIMVLYRGRVVEAGPADEVILAPRHPYTQLLAAAAPDPRRRRRDSGPPPGTVPADMMAGAAGGPASAVSVVATSRDATVGCRFRERCPARTDRCDRTPPDVRIGAAVQVTDAAVPESAVAGRHQVACWLPVPP